MDEKTKEMIGTFGAAAEVLRLFREQLEANGFTRTEAVKLVSDYMMHMLIGGSKNGQA